MTVFMVWVLADVTRNYNEGWVVEVVLRFLAGERLYAEPEPIVITNYPPLWYLLLAAAGRLGIDINDLGRVLQGASIIACCGLIGLICIRLGVNRWLSVVSGALFLGLVTSWLPVYIGINDPHWAGLACMLLGAWLVLGRGTRGLVLGAVACCVGGFIKHSLLPIPVSLCAYLLLVDRRAFAVFFGTLSALCAVGLAWCTFTWGNDFWNGIAPDREQHLWRARLHVQRNLPFYLAILVAGAAMLRLALNDSRMVWPLLYLGAALIIGVSAQVVADAAPNHLYDVLAALAVAAALAVNKSAAGTSRLAWPSATMILAVGAVLTFNVVHALPVTRTYLETREERNEDSRRAIEAIASIDGAVACEDAILCIRAGKLSELEFYGVGQYLAVGSLDADTLFSSLERKGVAAVQYFKDPGRSSRLPADTVEALLQMYPEQVMAGEHYSVYTRPMSAARSVPAEVRQFTP